MESLVHLSLLIQNRDPVLYDLDKCPQCHSSLPISQQELEEALRELNGLGFIEVFPFDEWYCPYCDFNLANSWYLKETSWYDPNIGDEFLDDVQLYLCCNTYSNGCSCPTSISFKDALARLDTDKRMVEEFYELDTDVGVDCSSCVFYKTESCDRLADDMVSLVHNEFIFPGVITPCRSYQYDDTREQSYDFKGLTPTVVQTRYSNIMKGRNARP